MGNRALAVGRKPVPFEPNHDRQIFLRSDPSGLAFEPHTGTLYVADARDGSILRLDGNRWGSRIAAIDSGGVVAASRLGGRAATPHGTLYVTRVGYGRAGAIFRIERDGAVAALPHLSPRVWRLGVAYDPRAHALYVTQFTKATFAPHDGAVVGIDLVSGATTTVAGGFVKPIGVVKLGSTLVVTDARQRAVTCVELSGAGAGERVVLANSIDRPDSICACEDGSVLVTTYDEATRRGSVRQIWLDGYSRVIASGPWEPRGVACDGALVYLAARKLARVLVFRL
jgi:DNA-binding beta-propeller fold protein YncE